ncbi:MAG: hypothetical protein RIK87_19585 [Fuerstiella sp.]
MELRERDVEVVGQVGATEQQGIVGAGCATLGIARTGEPPLLKLKEQVVGFESARLLPVRRGRGVVGQGGGDGVVVMGWPQVYAYPNGMSERQSKLFGTLQAVFIHNASERGWRSNGTSSMDWVRMMRLSFTHTESKKFPQGRVRDEHFANDSQRIICTASIAPHNGKEGGVGSAGCCRCRTISIV